MPCEKYDYHALATRYCGRQESTPQALLDTLLAQKKRYNPDGFLLAEAQNFDSCYFGSLVIFPYGPDNAFKAIPATPFSPRGLASDMSTAVAYLPAADLPAELPESLKGWQPPPPPAKKGKKKGGK